VSGAGIRGTLPAVFERAAARFPDRGVAIFDGRGRSFERLRYPEIWQRLKLAAGRWAALGLAPSDRVLVSLTSSWEWMDAWLGAALCGALPAAIAPGAALGGAVAQRRRLELIAESITARYVVVNESASDQAGQSVAPWLMERLLTSSRFAGMTSQQVSTPAAEPGETAFLQLTSGSTGLSRAVEISHRAALHNAYASDLAIGLPHGAPIHEWADSMVSWLPLHHDMGLVGCLLLSASCGFDLWLLQPRTFLARPRVWLEQLGLHGTAFAPAPNFGYQLCLERLAAEERQGLDLSGWSDAMTGAEMIRPETVEAFCDAFEPCGFRRESFRPCYGLAEGTLAVTFDVAGQGARTRKAPLDAGDVAGREIVCVGRPLVETTVDIVAPNGEGVAEGVVGEVAVAGPSVFSGYFGDPAATAESLRDGRLHTGDLGFLAGGELYITGRLKDILIVHGHNIMPHEIEWLAEGVVGAGGAARAGAFSVDLGAEGEGPVVVLEVESRDAARLAELEREIRQQVGRTLSLPLVDVVFVRRGQIPKTTSGKVQRGELRAAYVGRTIERL
jgi:fatty-acyl-CoA synthase